MQGVSFCGRVWPGPDPEAQSIHNVEEAVILRTVGRVGERDESNEDEQGDCKRARRVKPERNRGRCDVLSVECVDFGPAQATEWCCEHTVEQFLVALVAG